MTMFTVSEVIDGDSFEVTFDWRWNSESGKIVRPTGYDTPENGQAGFEEAKKKLRDLILEKEVDIRDCKTIDRGRLVADVYFNNKHLADYFPKYKS